MVSNRINARSTSSIATNQMRANQNAPVMATPAVAFGVGVAAAAVAFGVANGLIA
jgi:hypothetical protein